MSEPNELPVGEIIFPRVEFRNATLHQCLLYVRESVRREKGFTHFEVTLDSAIDLAPLRLITTSLYDIPLVDLLRFLGGVTRTKFLLDARGVCFAPEWGPDYDVATHSAN